MQCPLSEEDCRELEAWAEELEAAPGGGDRAGLLRRARAQGLQSRELQRQQSTPLKRFVFSSHSSPRSPSRGVSSATPSYLSPPRASLSASSASLASVAAVGSNQLEEDEEDHEQKKYPESRDSLGERLPAILDFCVDPPVLHVRRDNMFETRLGTYLKRRGLLTPTLIIFLVVNTVAAIWQPLATVVPEHGGECPYLSVGGRTVKIKVTRPGMVTWLLKDVSMMPVFFCVLHNVNSDLFFRALRTFDAVMILACFAMSDFAQFFNKFGFLAARGYYDTTWFVFDIVETVFVMIPGALILSTVDSWRVSAWVRGERRCFVKILSATIATAFFMKRYLDAHMETDVTEWTGRPSCLGPLCTTPKEVFVSAELTKVIFLLKLMAKYAKGWPFAFIRPIYNRHDSFRGRAIVDMIPQSGSLLKSQLAAIADSLSIGPGTSSSSVPRGSVLPYEVGDTNDSEPSHSAEERTEPIKCDALHVVPSLTSGSG